MHALYLASITLHVLAAMLWLGACFSSRWSAPVLRGVEPPELRRHLFNALGMRFRALSWCTMAVLLARGG